MVGGRLEGKIACVVGAGSSGEGLSNGRAVATLFAREGAKVFAIDADDRSLSATAEAIRTEGGTIEVFKANITDWDSVNAAMERCAELFGPITVLHNNVGIASTGGATRISFDEWNHVITTNMTGVFHTCRAVLPLMEAAGQGSIVNVSSLLTRKTLRKIPNIAYPASKAGLEQITRSIAMEYAPRGIRANNLILGLIDTPQIRSAYERRRKILQEEADRIWQNRGALPPMGRQGNPWEVARAALFLASDESSYITGADLVLDGGLSMAMD